MSAQGASMQWSDEDAFWFPARGGQVRMWRGTVIAATHERPLTELGF
ncbi:hypothetical protein ABZ921_10495 [Streptomyces atriruber]|uniref:Uncharacterized protein n=1 Tax=Streptomyces atriruber TaxID=545121 RepID=A0ABV3BJ58_9ACTN